MRRFLLLLLLISLGCQSAEPREKKVTVNPDATPHPSDSNVPQTPVQPQVADQTIRLNAQEAKFVELVNAYRIKVGCPALILDPTLEKLARNHSRDMATRDFFSHTNPDGQSPFDRMRAAGIRYSHAAENIAHGQRTAQEVLQSWLNSAGHKKNIENCKLRYHGIGFYDVTNHWTHVFATFR
ncbi:MAG: CAP domain-containing protein [Leptospiraceae bacterium]|nr:CAP domain-containing protein [Leptospiraceae bacterium]MCB1304631.1 CAP domain-containing protein [Leptospiraceae bacterium]